MALGRLIIFTDLNTYKCWGDNATKGDMDKYHSYVFVNFSNVFKNDASRFCDTDNNCIESRLPYGT